MCAFSSQRGVSDYVRFQTGAPITSCKLLLVSENLEGSVNKSGLILERHGVQDLE